MNPFNSLRMRLYVGTLTIVILFGTVMTVTNFRSAHHLYMNYQELLQDPLPELQQVIHGREHVMEFSRSLEEYLKAPTDERFASLKEDIQHFEKILADLTQFPELTEEQQDLMRQARADWTSLSEKLSALHDGTALSADAISLEAVSQLLKLAHNESDYFEKMSDLVGQEFSEINERLDAVHADMETESFIIIAIAMILALTGVAVLVRSIMTPLNQIKNGAHQFAHGNYAYRMPEESLTEFSQLSASFNKMADELEATYRRIHETSIRDHLTRVFNRREFSRVADAALERAQRNHLPISLIMLDIDHFKAINDTYGHPSGDLALVKVAECLGSGLRANDVLARYGSEEFAILLPDTDCKTIIAIAERLRASLEQLEINVGEDKTIRLTASLGISCAPGDGTSFDTLLAAADKRLYRAKQGGRNRIAFGEPGQFCGDCGFNTSP